MHPRRSRYLRDGTVKLEKTQPTYFYTSRLAGEASRQPRSCRGAVSNSLRARVQLFPGVREGSEKRDKVLKLLVGQPEVPEFLLVHVL